jgi:GDP-4-dehydro-6-deoxy-D-mannose reductase
MEKGARSQVYNVCSGVTRPLSEILGLLVKKSPALLRVVEEDGRLREVKTYRRLAGDNRKLRAETGWEPKIPFEKTLDDLLHYWRIELA